MPTNRLVKGVCVCVSQGEPSLQPSPVNRFCVLGRTHFFSVGMSHGFERIETYDRLKASSLSLALGALKSNLCIDTQASMDMATQSAPQTSHMKLPLHAKVFGHTACSFVALPSPSRPLSSWVWRQSGI